MEFVVSRGHGGIVDSAEELEKLKLIRGGENVFALCGSGMCFILGVRAVT